VSSQQCLDARDVGYLIVHRPSGTLCGLGKVDLAAGTSEFEDGPGGLGEYLDEVVQVMRLCRMWRHGGSLLRLWR
jgi:hypothetical protein